MTDQQLILEAKMVAKEEGFIRDFDEVLSEVLEEHKIHFSSARADRIFVRVNSQAFRAVNLI